MPEFFDVWIVMLAAFVATAAVVVGRLRHETSLKIAVNVAGSVAFFIGLAWSASLGGEAFAAAAVWSGGMALWDLASRIGRRRREETASASG